jgi:predicted porin
MSTIVSHTRACALSAVAALCACTAFAQSDVQLYGRVDLGLRYESAEHLPTTQMDSGTYSAIGFKGQEDLGGGLKAFFQMEHRIDASTGANKSTESFFNDISVIGLSGHFGTVRLGRSDNTFDLAADPDAFGGDYVGGRGNRRAGADEKWNNGVMYFTPEMHGFQAVVGTAFAEGAESAGARLKNPVAAALLYKNSRLSASVGYMQRANQDKVVGGSATYDLGFAKTFLTVAHNNGKGNAAQIMDGEQDGKRSTYDLGVAIPVGAAGSVRAKYNFDRKNLKATAGALTKTHDLGLGYWHHLSQRTQLYVTGNVEKIEGYKTTRAMDMGIVHNF